MKVLTLIILVTLITSNLVNNQPVNSCFSVSQGTLTNPKISEYYSVSSFTFTITNTCSTAQQMNNLGINVYWLVNGEPASEINTLNETGSPYLTQTLNLSGDYIAITLTTPSCSGSCSWAYVNANSQLEFDLQVGYNGVISTSEVTQIQVLGGGINNTGQLKITANLPEGLVTALGSISNTDSNFPFTLTSSNPSVSLNLNTGEYYISLQGTGDIVTGDYLGYTPSQLSVNLGQNSVTLQNGPTSLTKVTANVVFSGDSCANQVTVSVRSQNFVYLNQASLSNGQTITLIESENYEFLASRVIGCFAKISLNENTLNVDLTQILENKFNIGGYYESWVDTYTTDPSTVGLTKLPAYLTYVMIAFGNPLMNYTKGSYTFNETGVGFTPSFEIIQSAINLAHQSNPQQLILLSVGGESYPWLPGQNNYQAIVDLANDLGVDGVDIDFESMPICTNVNTDQVQCSTDSELEEIISTLRSLLGPSKLLTAATWSVGAYGNAQFPYTEYPPGSNYDGDWINPLNKYGYLLNATFLMSYEAGSTYSPTDALMAYKAIYDGPIFVGFEVPPESYQNYTLTLAKAASITNFVMENNGGGVFIWSLQTKEQIPGLNAQAYLSQSCTIFGLKGCNDTIPQ